MDRPGGALNHPRDMGPVVVPGYSDARTKRFGQTVHDLGRGRRAEETGKVQGAVLLDEDLGAGPTSEARADAVAVPAGADVVGACGDHARAFSAGQIRDAVIR